MGRVGVDAGSMRGRVGADAGVGPDRSVLVPGSMRGCDTHPDLMVSGAVGLSGAAVTCRATPRASPRPSAKGPRTHPRARCWPPSPRRTPRDGPEAEERRRGRRRAARSARQRSSPPPPDGIPGAGARDNASVAARALSRLRPEPSPRRARRRGGQGVAAVRRSPQEAYSTSARGECQRST